GVALMTTEVRARRLALFREMLPRLSRVAILTEPHVHRSTLRDVEGAAGTMGIHIEWVEVAGREQLDSLASRLRAAQVHGVYIAENPIIDGIAPRIATISRQQRLPTVFAFRDAVEAGGLMSYGASFPATQRRGVRPQDPGRRQPGRDAHRAGGPLRAHRQPQDGAPARADRPPVHPAAGRADDRLASERRAPWSPSRPRR